MRFLPALTFLVGMLLGSGAIWQFLQWQHSQREHELNAIREGTNLRDKILERYSKAVELGVQYRDASNADKGIIKTKILANMEDVFSLEQTLAKLESRKPRTFPIPLPPSPVTDARIQP
jgi:hypothetical protein